MKKLHHFGRKLQPLMVKQYDAIVSSNHNGGLYVKGRRYPHKKKLEVANTFFRLFYQGNCHGKIPTIRDVAKDSNVSISFAGRILNEIKILGDVINPSMLESFYRTKNKCSEGGMKLNLRERKYILQLRTERPDQPNFDYTKQLYKRFGKSVCSKTITNFFRSKREFMFEGSFCIPNNVPIDKFTKKNLLKVYAYRETMTVLKDFVSKFSFLDEKHIVNKDCIRKMVRKDLLTGKTPATYVSGDFRECYKIFAAISGSPTKATPIAYHIETNNGTAICFVSFTCNMIRTRCLHHNEILIMDNAAVHTGKETHMVRNLLWDTIIDNKPLNILVVYLPPRCPELNPIEKMFHILSKRVRRF